MANVQAGYIVPPLQMEDVTTDSEDHSSPANEMSKYVALKQKLRKRIFNHCQDTLNFFGHYKRTVIIVLGFIAISILFFALVLRIWIRLDKNSQHDSLPKMLVEQILEEKQDKFNEPTSPVEEFLNNGIKRKPPFDSNLKILHDILAEYKNFHSFLPQHGSTRFKRDITDERRSACRRKDEDCKIILEKVHGILGAVDYKINELRNLLPDIVDCLECRQFEAVSPVAIIDNTTPENVFHSHGSYDTLRKMDGVHNLPQMDAFFRKDDMSYVMTRRPSINVIPTQQTKSIKNQEDTTIRKYQQVSKASGNLKNLSEIVQAVEASLSETELVAGIQQDNNFETDSFGVKENTTDSHYDSSRITDGQLITNDIANETFVVNNPLIKNFTRMSNFSISSMNPILMQPYQPNSFAAKPSGLQDMKSAVAKVADDFNESEPRSIANPNILPISPTGESITSSQQLQYTPIMAPWNQIPVCFYGSPFTPYKQSAPGGTPFPVSSPTMPYPTVQQPLHGQTFVNPSGLGQPLAPYPIQNQPQPQQAIQFIPVPYLVPMVPQRIGPTGPGAQSPRQPYFCTYLSAPAFQFPTIPDVSTYQRNMAEVSSPGGKGTPQEARGRLDSIFQDNYNDYPTACNFNAHLCTDGSRCVEKVRWCDGNVDCPDASDETKCSCRDRIGKERLCDGYFDCPHGEDELGCFGCGRLYFSCNDWNRRYPKQNCIPLSQRCDGIKHCHNGKDEIDCSILTQTLGNNNIFSVGYINGYLHKNWKGQWYPVCTPSVNLAMEACHSEIGSGYSHQPMIKFDYYFPRNLYDGPYLVEDSVGEMSTVTTCFGKAVYVECPPMPCGTRLTIEEDNVPTFNDIFDDPLLKSSNDSGDLVNATSVQNDTILVGDIPKAMEELIEGIKNVTSPDQNNDTIVGTESRVVGGRDSQPRAWPFLVAIYKDGLFHCGGAILDEYWILSAAHCVDNFQNHYFEVQAGVLRRFSYSPTSQIRRVKYIVIHEDYDRRTMINDISLIRLVEPLHFNRWVRPACLPEDITAGLLWRRGPLPETRCVTMGWGATVERGPDPDHMREVEVPILPFCKHEIDRNGAEICAGISQGGRDACQGDSGGPLMCRNPEYPSNWYVAGIVSHGEGCGRPGEPGVYTKVSPFVDWIKQVIDNLPMNYIGRRPMEICPGFRCKGGLNRCLPPSSHCDGTVDCLDAEDELHCFGFHNRYDLYKLRESNIDANNSSAQADAGKYGGGSPFEDTILTRARSHPGDANSDQSQRIYNNDASKNSPSKDAIEPNISISTKPVAPWLTENMTNIVIDNKTSAMKPSASRYFTCTMLIQNIPINKHCDKNVDCEDGSDEIGCTCKDYLLKVNPTGICDGHVDCRDNSDEENCIICNTDEFHCRRSGECILMSKRCDRNFDCTLSEDEEDCFTLTNGEYVIIDLDGQPHLNSEGIITWYVNAQWRPACYHKDAGEAKKLGEYMCDYFGFGGLESITELLVQDKPLGLKFSSGREVLPYEYSPIYVAEQGNNETCAGFFVRCISGASSGVNAHLVDMQRQENATYLWPWHVAIFVDNMYRCSAVLLDQQWLLTSSHCILDVDVTRNYTAAMLGLSRSYFYVDGPHQQLTPVDKIKHMMSTDAALLHLRYPVNLTRHIKPVFFHKKSYAPLEDDPCVAVGVDDSLHTKSVFLQPVLSNCTICRRCFKRVFPEEKCNENGTSTMWSGTITCRSRSGAWYPAAVYHEPYGSCGFRNVNSFTSIDYIDKLLVQAMDEPVISSESPPCDGFRCSLGKCIFESRVCDGVPDCRDKADEDQERCKMMKENCDNGVIDITNCKCRKSELRCENGQCIPKQAFCNGRIDCTDGTDEPSDCSCAAYLKLVTPRRICDGSRDCLDKSDEDPKVCFCKDSSFKCPATDGQGVSCVPQDFVCDGMIDCPGGHDEMKCRTIKGTSQDRQGSGEVLQRSYGIWHSECFPNEITSSKEVADLCRTLGYSSGTIAKNSTSRINPVTVSRLAQFYMVRLNDQCWIKMKSDGPMVTVVSPENICNVPDDAHGASPTSAPSRTFGLWLMIAVLQSLLIIRVLC